MGSSLAVAYGGDAEEEHGALGQGCGLADAGGGPLLALVGADRGRFLHGLVTCDVKGLGVGQGSYGFFTGPQGRILSDVVVLARQDRLWLLLPAGVVWDLKDHLEKYIVADRVEVEVVQDEWSLLVAGPRLEDALPEAASVPEEPWRHCETTVLGRQVLVVRDVNVGVPAVSVWVKRSGAAELFRGVLKRGADLPLRPVGFDALERARILAGIPRWGQDFSSQTLPQETGREDAVDFEKGCYLGQEVVARIHYRGQVSRRLCKVSLTGDEPPAVGTSLSLEGREVGVLTSLTSSSFPVALAMVQRRGADVGTRLVVEGGREAVVVDGGE